MEAVHIQEAESDLCRRVCPSGCLLCWQSHVLGDRWLCTQVSPVWDTPHSRHPRQHPLSSSTCPDGISQAPARHTHPRATSGSTAHCACLEKLKMKVICPRTLEERMVSDFTAVLLPTQVRPELSKVRPSAHSQRNEPWVFTQRPFLHTPGNTSHSLMSAFGESKQYFEAILRHTLQEVMIPGQFSVRHQMFSPSQTRPFMRASPREQAVSENHEKSRCDVKYFYEAIVWFIFDLINCHTYVAVINTSTSLRTDLAGFTRAAPRSSQRGAALRLQRGSVDVDFTAVVLNRKPAGTLHAICRAKEQQREESIAVAVTALL